MAKRIGESPYANATESRIKAVDLFQFDDAKVVEATREIVKYEQEYAAAVPEHTYLVQYLFTPREALATIGMQPK